MDTPTYVFSEYWSQGMCFLCQTKPCLCCQKIASVMDQINVGVNLACKEYIRRRVRQIGAEFHEEHWKEVVQIERDTQGGPPYVKFKNKTSNIPRNTTITSSLTV